MSHSHKGGHTFQKCSEKKYLKIFLLCRYFVLTGILKPHSENYKSQKITINKKIIAEKLPKKGEKLLIFVTEMDIL